MVELHVWGLNNQVSIISPECLASAWALGQKLDNFQIICSNNTNISDIGKLPVLIDNNTKYQGFEQIIRYLDYKFDDSTLNLLDQSLIALFLNKFEILSQYNLYIVRENYDNFTIKLFKDYLPFPMMYNQPLKFYGYAQNQVSILGLNNSNKGFFKFGNIQSEIPPTETVDDKSDDEVALTALHEKQLLKKNKKKQDLTEFKNCFKVSKILNESILDVTEIYKKNLNLLDGPNRLLLQAYLTSYTDNDLSNQFIKLSLESHKDFVDDILKSTKELNENIIENFATPKSYQAPTLINEVKYLTGQIRY